MRCALRVRPLSGGPARLLDRFPAMRSGSRWGTHTSLMTFGMSLRSSVTGRQHLQGPCDGVHPTQLYLTVTSHQLAAQHGCHFFRSWHVPQLLTLPNFRRHTAAAVHLARNHQITKTNHVCKPPSLAITSSCTGPVNSYLCFSVDFQK